MSEHPEAPEHPGAPEAGDPFALELLEAALEGLEDLAAGRVTGEHEFDAALREALNPCPSGPGSTERR